MGRNKLELSGSGYGQVTDTCECGNELPGSIKCRELLDLLIPGQLLKKDFPPGSK